MNKAEKIRESILNIAKEIFSKYGFGKTSMDDIAQKARKGKSTLYYYFKSKEDLFAAVVDKEANYIMNELLKIISVNDKTENIFRNYAIRRFQLIENVANFYNIVKEEYLNYFPIIQRLRAKYDEFEIIALKQILLKGILNNEIRISENQVDDVALSLAAAIKGLELPIFIDHLGNSLEKKLEVMLDIFFNGLLKK